MNNRNRYLLTKDDRPALFFNLPDGHSNTIYNIVRSNLNNLTYYITGGDKKRQLLYCIVQGTHKEKTTVHYWELIDYQCYVVTDYKENSIYNIY